MLLSFFFFFFFFFFLRFCFKQKSDDPSYVARVFKVRASLISRICIAFVPISFVVSLVGRTGRGAGEGSVVLKKRELLEESLSLTTCYPPLLKQQRPQPCLYLAGVAEDVASLANGERHSPRARGPAAAPGSLAAERLSHSRQLAVPVLVSDEEKVGAFEAVEPGQRVVCAVKRHEKLEERVLLPLEEDRDVVVSWGRSGWGG